MDFLWFWWSWELISYESRKLNQTNTLKRSRLFDHATSDNIFFNVVFGIFNNVLLFCLGEIILVRPLDEITAISHPGVPILLTVVAEEIKTSRDEPPAMSSTVQLALILGERGNQPPYFENDK